MKSSINNQIIFDLLNEVRPEANFLGSENYVDDGLLDSFDVIMLVSAIEKAFSIKIPGDEIIIDNFINSNSIIKMVKKLSNEV